MKLSPLAAMSVFFPAFIAGCASKASEAPLNVSVRGPASACTIEVDGRKVTTDQLLQIARPEARRGRRAHIDANMAETPYRCFGGVIYTLQMAGFKDVGFVAEPPPQR